MSGFIVEALDRRRKAGLSTVTLLCCDNLPENGLSLKKAICGFARLRDTELADWIETNIAFPCTMVDRIVPATTKADIDSTAKSLGQLDNAPVICEPFSQWIIEDKFSSYRPAWEEFGATMVDEVAPYEEMKLRLLNCSHSAMAYLGYLAGIETIDQVIETPKFCTFVEKLMKEVVPTLSIPKNVNVHQYCSELIERFRNPSLKHRTWQIAMDGSQKIPQRVVDTIRALKATDSSYPCLALSVAGWLRYVTGVDEQGEAIDVNDPLAEQLRNIADTHKNDFKTYARKVVQIEEVFGADLAGDAEFLASEISALETIYAKGAMGAIKDK